MENNFEVLNEKENNYEVATVKQKFEFMRVDFTDTSTINDYGLDVIRDVESVIAKAAGMDNSESLPSYDFKEKVDKLTDFSKELDKLEEERTTPKKGLAKLIHKFRRTIAPNSEKEMSYSEQYKNYDANIDAITADIQTRYEEARKDFVMYGEFIKQMKPYLEIMENVYEVGCADLSVKEKEVELLEEQYKENPTNFKLQRESTLSRFAVEEFKNRLDNISKFIISMNQVVIEWNMSQINVMKYVRAYKDFLSVNAPLLKINGAALVGAKKQKEEVELISYLVDGVNSALAEGPKELNSVIEKVNEIDKEGTLKLSTFKTIDEYLEEGKSLLKKGSQDKISFRKKEAEAIKELTSRVKSFGLDIQEQILLDNIKDNESMKPRQLVKKNR